MCSCLVCTVVGHETLSPVCLCCVVTHVNSLWCVCLEYHHQLCRPACSYTVIANDSTYVNLSASENRVRTTTVVLSTVLGQSYFLTLLLIPILIHHPHSTNSLTFTSLSHPLPSHPLPFPILLSSPHIPFPSQSFSPPFPSPLPPPILLPSSSPSASSVSLLCKSLLLSLRAVNQVIVTTMLLGLRATTLTLLTSLLVGTCGGGWHWGCQRTGSW